MDPSLYEENGVGKFVGMIFLLMFTALVGEALGVFYGIASNNVDHSVTVANVTALSMLIFGGFYTKDLPVFMDWLQYLSVLKYCYDALCLLQFGENDVYDCDNGYYIAACYQNTEISGAEVRAWLGVDELTIGGNIGVIVAIYVGLKILGYVALINRSEF